VTVSVGSAEKQVGPDDHRRRPTQGQGLSQDKVSGIVSRLAGFNRGRARELVLTHEQNTRAAAPPKEVADAPTAVVPAAAPARPGPTTTARVVEAVTPAPPGSPGTAELLAYAEQSSDPRLKRTAAKVRALVAEIRARVETLSAEQAAAKRVADLEAELTRARATLRACARRPTDSNAAAKPAATTSADYRAKVRAWAAANGTPCHPVGRIPRAVTDAYEAAHANGDSR
jgi:hypothetical protein